MSPSVPMLAVLSYRGDIRGVLSASLEFLLSRIRRYFVQWAGKAELKDPQLELVQLRSCLGSCKVLHLLSCKTPAWSGGPPVLWWKRVWSCATGRCMRPSSILYSTSVIRGRMALNIFNVSGLPYVCVGLGGRRVLPTSVDICFYTFLACAFQI